jgi:hypothetical protein
MSLPGIETHMLTNLAFDPAGKFLVAGGGGLVRQQGKSTALRELIVWSLSNAEVLQHLVEPSRHRVADIAFRPNGKEFATKSTGDIDVWSADVRHSRQLPSDFLAGPLTYSDDGEWIIAPAGNVIKIRSSETGEVTRSIKIADSLYTSAKSVAFVCGTSHLVVGAQVIDQKGHISGKIFLVDLITCEIIHESNLEFEPDSMVVGSNVGRLCLAGKRRGRGCVMFWDLKNWIHVADQGAHGSSVGNLALSPDGKHLASTGVDQLVRIWRTDTGKTIDTLKEHRAEGLIGGNVAWSPDGKFIAFATGGAPPSGGVFLYENHGDSWKLTPGSRGVPLSEDPQTWRHVMVHGDGNSMDTFGNFDLATNQLPKKCPSCTFPDIDAVPQPYLLNRGISDAGDFGCAELGNFFVRERLRQILEVVSPHACLFYPTSEAKSGKPTDWWLAVPQRMVDTVTLPAQYEQCNVCGEPKSVSHLDRLEFSPPEVDIFKSKQWTCWQIGEETPWYRDENLKGRIADISPEQWTRLCLSRELWCSNRLLLLLKELKIKGVNYLSALHQCKATPWEAAWIAAQIERVNKDLPPVKSKQKFSDDSGKWFTAWIKKSVPNEFLASASTIKAWEKKHGIRLPKEYVKFATAVGKQTFADMFGKDEYDVTIVGLGELDAEGYRRDFDDEAIEQSPDGLMFAVAINGDCLCFDLHGESGKYPVFHYDHETEAFQPFAENFAAAVRRLVEKT